MGGDERLGVGDLQGQSYAFGVELEGVGDVTEGTAFAQVLAYGFEVVFAYGLAQLQAGGGDDLLWRVTSRAGDFDGDQLDAEGTAGSGPGAGKSTRSAERSGEFVSLRGF